MAATKMFLIKWYSSSINLKVFQIWKTSWTTYLLVVWKSSGLLGSLLTKSSGLPRKSSGLPGSRFSDLDLICRFFRSGRLLGRLTCFSDLEDFLDDLPVSPLKVVWKSSGLIGSLLTKSSGLPGSRLDFQEVVWTSRKSSELHGSLLTKSPFHNRSERFGF
ncbi:hypothetical protein F2Q69_00044603 [Brassica cretica]|uniref:Uncharacterized protein n=1 Tax=Brassica cretica TaxID=69181 RepID=A0A8S9NI77_BRACR|nr:hypothetical protein F2Q69_00044603 [Brassica cretica]